MIKFFKSFFIIVIFFIIGNCRLQAQGEIVSVNPSSAFTGETTHLIIQGANTNFIRGTTNVIFHNCNITVNSVTVNNSELLTANITVAKDVPEGECKFEIFTGEISYYGELEIVKMAEQVEATITVFPVQSIYLTDYDLSNLRNLPLLFNVTIFMAGQNYLKVVAELSHEKYGKLAIATKKINSTGTAIVSFDNKEFDTYDLTEASDELIESIPPGGTLPPGTYHCKLTVFNKNDEIVSNAETSFYIPEPITAIDLISPGTDLSSTPVVIFSQNPYFEWFGNATEYEFKLYEVYKGQHTEDEIALNLPVYKQQHIKTSNFIYPNYAEILKPGKTYAWQIVAKLTSTAGEKEVSSKMLWFVYNNKNVNEKKNNISYFILEPDDITLSPGDSVKLNITGFETSGNPVPLECTLKVIPSDGGTIHKGKWFIAGKKAGTYAILATCGNKENYVTFKIKKN